MHFKNYLHACFLIYTRQLTMFENLWISIKQPQPESAPLALTCVS